MIINIFVDRAINSATARFRGFIVADELIKRNYKVKLYSPFKKDTQRRFSNNSLVEIFNTIRILYKYESNEVSYLVRTVSSMSFALTIVVCRIFLNRKYIFDFDDAIYLKPRVSLQTRLLVRFASYVLVGSHTLHKWVIRRNRNVDIVPTVVPFSSYRGRKLDNPSSMKGCFTIGWIGHAVNHIKNLKLLVPVLERLVSLGLDFKFTVIGGLPSSDSRFDFLKKINGYQLEIVEHLDWGDNDAVPEALSCFDVGVMPLVSDPKTEGKCAFKIIQYMGVGLPAIASPVGENSVVIQDGLNGYLADDTDEWVQYLSDLSQDSELRYSIGSRASHRVKDSYSYEYAIPKVVNALKSVVYEN